MQSEVNQEENLNRIITVPNLLSFFRLCLIPVIIWSYCVKKNPLLAGEILLLSGLTDLADGIYRKKIPKVGRVPLLRRMPGSVYTLPVPAILSSQVLNTKNQRNVYFGCVDYC